MSKRRPIDPDDLVLSRAPGSGRAGVASAAAGLGIDAPPWPTDARFDLSNVVPFARTRRGPVDTPAPAIVAKPEARPAPITRDRRRRFFLGLLFCSLVAHGALLTMFWEEPKPLASVGVEVITVEIMVGATTAAGFAITPGENEVESPAQLEEAKPDERPSEEEQVTTEAAQDVPVAEREMAPQERSEERSDELMPERPVEQRAVTEAVDDVREPVRPTISEQRAETRAAEQASEQPTEQRSATEPAREVAAAKFASEQRPETRTEEKVSERPAEQRSATDPAREITAAERVPAEQRPEERADEQASERPVEQRAATAPAREARAALRASEQAPVEGAKLERAELPKEQVPIAAAASRPEPPQEQEPIEDSPPKDAEARTVEPKQPPKAAPKAKLEPKAKPEPEPEPKSERKPAVKRAERAPERRRIAAPTAPKAKRQARPRPSFASTAASGIGRGRSDLSTNYRGLVAAHLARHKQYPASARSSGTQGSGTVTFSLDGSGRVTSVSVVRGTGVAVLDAEIAAMVRRASPFPAPPGGRSMRFTVPVGFRLN